MWFESQVVAHELPDVFDGIEFGAFGWQRDDADIFGCDERLCHMPPCPIHEYDGMGTRGHGLGDFGKMQGHRVGIADR